MRSALAVLRILTAVLATSTLAFAADKPKDADLQRVQDSINKDKQEKGAVRTDPDKGRVSVENKSGAGVYVEGGGKAPSHDNPKGEVKGGAGAQIRFGGGDKKENKKDK